MPSARETERQAEEVNSLGPYSRAAFVAAVAERALLPLQAASPTAVQEVVQEAMSLLWTAASGSDTRVDDIREIQDHLAPLIPRSSEDDDEDLFILLGCLHHALEALINPSFVAGVLTLADTDLAHRTELTILESSVGPQKTSGNDWDALIERRPEVQREVAFRNAVLQWLRRTGGGPLGAYGRTELLGLMTEK